MSNETKILVGISVVTIVIVVGAAMTFGGKSSDTTSTKPISNTAALVRSDSHVDGPKDAKVTVVEFGDYQCPACGAAYPTVTQILAAYKGQIRYVFREFPLPMHQNAQAAAEAAEAAGAQGKYFDMYNLLYTNQTEWGETNNANDYFIKYAQQLKLNMDTFKSDITSKKYAKKIQKDMDDGDAVSVDSTPTFFINGVKEEGGMQYSDFKDKIDAAIKAAK